MRRSWTVAILTLALVLSSGVAGAAGGKKKPPKKKPPSAPEPAPTPEATPAPDAGPAEAAPAPTPAAEPAKAAASKPAEGPTQAETEADQIDVDGMRKQYEQLRDKLFTSRATSAAVGDTLYNARLRVHLHYGGTSRFWGLRRVTVRVDGANVYDDSSGAIATDDAPRFETFVAPGRHVVTVRIEAVSKDDDRLTTSTETSVVVDAPEKKLTLVRARADDDGDIGWSWKRRSKGSYKLRLDVAVEAKDVKESDAK
jgi:hypothetical protein